MISLLFFLLGLAQAEDGWNPAAELRETAILPPAVPVDADGGTPDQSFVLEQRLRLGLGWQNERWRLATEWDLGAGQAAGDTWALGSEDERARDVHGAWSLDGIQARQGYASARLGPVRVDAGLVLSRWGMGLVANDGEGDPLFGWNRFGDRYYRLRVATKAPKAPLTMLLAGDVVLADESARLDRDQLAMQGVGVVLLGEPQKLHGGLLATYRHQEEDFREALDPRVTTVTLLDLTGAWPLSLGGWTVGLEGEGAAQLGHTNRAETYESPDGLRIATGALVGEARATPKSDHLDLILRGGWLSGDATPDDDTSHTFAADRDFDAGLVLFREVMGDIDARAWQMMSDPEHSAQPPDGGEQIVGEGALRGASFLMPVLAARPKPWLEGRLGLVSAWATGAPSQPFYTYRMGGVPTNQHNEPVAGRAIGTELDWSLRLGSGAPWGASKGWALRPQPALILSGGHAFLSENLGGGMVTLLAAQGRLRF